MRSAIGYLIVALALFLFLIGWLFLRRVPEGEP